VTFPGDGSALRRRRVAVRARRVEGDVIVGEPAAPLVRAGLPLV
jgi:hypothetical protein